MNITIWHNPRCSKSRQTLALLEEFGGDIDIRKYLDDGPSVAEIQEVLIALGFDSARKMMRRGESLYKSLELKNADEKTLIAAMSDHPILIERPIVIVNNSAVLGRPPENVHQLLR